MAFAEKQERLLLQKESYIRIWSSKIDVFYVFIKFSHRLTFKNTAVNLHTNFFSTIKLCVFPTLHLCILCDSQNNQ